MEVHLKALENGEKISEQNIKAICDKVHFFSISRLNKFYQSNPTWFKLEHQ